MGFARRYILPVVFFVVYSCQKADHSYEMHLNLDAEIKQHLLVLKSLSVPDGNLNLLITKLHTETERLLALSDSCQNPYDCVERANRYFTIMSKVISGYSPGPLLLNADMNKNQIQLGIKQNELWLLNKLVYLNKVSGRHLIKFIEKTISCK